MARPLNYLDAFSGIGGFHRGLEEAGFRFGWVGFSEIDKYAKQIYKKHFPSAEDMGDVRTIIPAGKLPGRLDLFTFGFPCQDLSMAGKRRGLHAARSGLFFEAVQIIKAASPTVFIFENVKGLLSSSDWRDFTAVLRAIADLGVYECEWQLLNTQWFLPQNRERVYFIGHLRGKSRPKVFPFGEGDPEIIELQRRLRGQMQAQRRGPGGGHPDGQVCQAGSDGPLCGYVIPVKSAANEKVWGGRRFKEPEEPMFTLTCHDRHGIIVHSLQPRSPDRPSLRNKTSSGGSGPLSREDGNTYCLDSGNGQAVETVTGIRRLTPLECERLQGFPDGWTEGVSDTQRYKCLGNAVSVPVVRAIGERLIAGWNSK
ncbi:MAG: DNA cytosine methyltransferase [Thermodesulfobacteriota bacterium]|nr:MAG: DNA cytosine methyltransferase [Thermodesulfobacteriota bacterium]